MVKVGGYILGEFGNLIAGDQRSSPLVQFQLLHSKVFLAFFEDPFFVWSICHSWKITFFCLFQYHLCSPMTRALLLSTYVKFVNLFPEIKHNIQEVFKQHSNLRSADAELQQRASEYLQLSVIASTDVLVSNGVVLICFSYGEVSPN